MGKSAVAILMLEFFDAEASCVASANGDESCRTIQVGFRSKRHIDRIDESLGVIARGIDGSDADDQRVTGNDPTDRVDDVSACGGNFHCVAVEFIGLDILFFGFSAGFCRLFPFAAVPEFHDIALYFAVAEFFETVVRVMQNRVGGNSAGVGQRVCASAPVNEDPVGIEEGFGRVRSVGADPKLVSDQRGDAIGCGKELVRFHGTRARRIACGIPGDNADGVVTFGF